MSNDSGVHFDESPEPLGNPSHKGVRRLNWGNLAIAAATAATIFAAGFLLGQRRRRGA